MKILSASQIREIDDHTIRNEPIPSIDLMERAAKSLCEWFVQQFDNNTPVKIFCGIGNNGGDGLALARMLHKKEYQVKVFVVRYSTQSSEDFQVNEERLQEIKDIPLIDLDEQSVFPALNTNDIIVDGLWGSGLNRGIEGFSKGIIQHINDSGGTIVSVDIPSGLFADKHSDGLTIKASYTVSFEVPKLAFMFPENFEAVGEWSVIPIGLDKNFIAMQETGNEYLVKEDIQKIIKQRKKFDHKGTYGHALVIGGSLGKMGAAVLAAEACLRVGTGLVTAHVPAGSNEILQSAIPEIMVSLDEHPSQFSKIPDISKYNAIGIGPGIGTEEPTPTALSSLLKGVKVSLVIDADGINILAEHKQWLEQIPENSILTPHPKEFERLLGTTKDNFERQQVQIAFSKKYKVFLVLKGAQSAITCPDGTCYFNSTGNPGMATAGSGDVLTGIITGLLAQGYTPGEAAKLGVYLHGFAGDLAVKKGTMETMIAGDIISHLQDGFKELGS